MDYKLRVSICIPAHNEEKNIAHILKALLVQKTKYIAINKIVVVSSDSTDATNTIVEEFTKNNEHITLIKQQERAGKASAINTFLRNVDDEVVVIESADTIPHPDCIEKLCLPFLKNKKIGMTGGAPIPVNDPNTFLGYIIHTWWWFHRNIPRFGEIIAYRNVLPQISENTAVDEAYIQAKLIQIGYENLHVDEAIVNNKGAETIGDLIKQRRRIFNGHSRLLKSENVKINHMTKSAIYLLLFKYEIKNIKHLTWLIAGFSIEAYAQALGHFDLYITKSNPVMWDIAKSTKNVKYTKAIK